MRQQVPHRHFVPPLGIRPRGPFRQIALNRRVEVHSSAASYFGQMSDQRCRHHGLRQRSDIVNRVGANCGRRSLIGLFAETANRQLAAVTDGQNAPGTSAAPEVGGPSVPLRSVTVANSATMGISYLSAGGSLTVDTLTNAVSVRITWSESTRHRNSRSRSSPGYGSGSESTTTSNALVGLVAPSGPRCTRSRKRLTPRSLITCPHR